MNGTHATIHCANIDEEQYVTYANQLVTIAYRESLLEILKQTVKNYRKSHSNPTQSSEQHPTRKKANSICQMTTDQTSTSPITNNLFVSTSVLMPSSSSINLPISTETEKYFVDIASKKFSNESEPAVTIVETPPPRPPPVPNCNTLSLQLAIQSLPAHNPKPRAMYSFRCGLDFRKDELASHYRDIHNMIHSGLDGWIEHRCPLFTYGCSFVHRRWSPNMPNADISSQRTLIYNSHLEAFACPSTTSSLTNSVSSSMDSILQKIAQGSSDSSSFSDYNSINSSPSQQYSSSSVSSSSSSLNLPSKNVHISFDDFPFDVSQIKLIN